MEIPAVVQSEEARTQETPVLVYMYCTLYMYIYTCIQVYINMLMRDAEGRKKQARSYKQQSKAIHHTQGTCTCTVHKDSHQPHNYTRHLKVYMSNQHNILYIQNVHNLCMMRLVIYVQ